MEKKTKIFIFIVLGPFLDGIYLHKNPPGSSDRELGSNCPVGVTFQSNAYRISESDRGTNQPLDAQDKIQRSKRHLLQ